MNYQKVVFYLNLLTAKESKSWERVEYYKKIVHDLFSTDAMAVGFVIPEEVPLKLKIDHTDHHVLRFKWRITVKFILLTKK